MFAATICIQRQFSPFERMLVVVRETFDMEEHIIYLNIN
jgi:hypothetical protein